MGTWDNNDGLHIEFGPTKAVPNVGGELKNFGSLSEVQFRLDLTTLGTAAAVLSDTVFFPKNARIEEVEIVTHTAATSSGSAVLNLGLISYDRTTEIDYDGFVAALAKTAYDAAGEKTVIRVGSTGAGALLGTTNATVGYVTADYDTAAFTAGVLDIRIRYYPV